MAVKREYSAGKFMIEIEGVSVGFLLAVEGGEPVASVISESNAVGDPVRKHLGSVTYDPIRMSFGAGMGAPLYQWMTDWLTGDQPIRSGAIVFLDYNLKERSRLVFDKASITEVEFPAVDATSTEEGFFSVTLQPEVTRSNTASAGAVKSGFGGKNRKLTVANFSLKIGNQPVLRVNKIDLLTVKGPLARGEVRGLRIPNLAFTLPEDDAKEWFDWFHDFAIKGNNGADKERGGTLEFLSPNLTTLFTLTLFNLGVFRVNHERHEAGAEVMARVRVELYCERITLSRGPDAIGVAIAPAPSAAPSKAPADALLLVQALLAVLTDPVPGSASKDNGPVEAERIARRLRASKNTADPAALSPPKRDEGAAIGARWAAKTATLDELERIAALEPRQWSAIRLPDRHSLAALLLEAGVIPAGGGALDLERDSFVEGLVAGASQVLRDASPHLPE